MLDAVVSLVQQKQMCCEVYPWIVGDTLPPPDEEHQEDVQPPPFASPDLNESQNLAVQNSLHAPLSLIWGPPGASQCSIM